MNFCLPKLCVNPKKVKSNIDICLNKVYNIYMEVEYGNKKIKLP